MSEATEATVYVAVKLDDPSFGRLAIVHTEPLHENPAPPASSTIETKVMLVGVESVSVTLVAAFGPMLAT